MKTKFIYKLIISLIFFCNLTTGVFAKEVTFVSLAPSITEIVYALGAEDGLLGVSTECNYPKEAQEKPKIGNTYFLNKEMLIKLKPDYLLTVEGAQFKNTKISDKIPVTTLCFTMESVNAVYETVLAIGKLTGKEENALKIVKKLSSEIDSIKPLKQLRILYLIQLNPIITIGNKSYISDIIRKSGQINVTDGLNSFYPAVSYEYILNSKPDIIIISFKSDYEKIEKLFPDTKIMFLTDEQNSLINRPGPRINKSVEFFANLKAD